MTSRLGETDATFSGCVCAVMSQKSYVQQSEVLRGSVAPHTVPSYFLLTRSAILVDRGSGRTESCR